MMPPVRSIKNQYRGVNAHLHSILQAESKWNRFHNYAIGKLMEVFKALVLPMGYTVEREESLQIRRVGDDLPRRPRADLLILDRTPDRTIQASPMMRGQALLLEELDEEDFEYPYHAAVVYEILPTSEEPVAWIELLSPGNKGSSKDAYTYIAKRRLILERGLVLVEIDLLHETPPTFERLPDYSQGEAGAYPYRILVIDPRPEYHEARVYLHEFGVDARLPMVDVPLNAGNIVTVDFDALYQKTFHDGLYGHNLDYHEFPMNFDRYSAADQVRIANRMLAVLKAAQRGSDLESAPFEAEAYSLEASLEMIAALKAES
jgi:hypothetical protein